MRYPRSIDKMSEEEIVRTFYSALPKDQLLVIVEVKGCKFSALTCKRHLVEWLTRKALK